MTTPADILFNRIDSDDELKRTFWCMMANARSGQKRAAENDNLMAFAYYSGALGGYADVLALGAPAALRPDGSETNKP